MSLRIAMWSGPRNISTAMLRSWENRPDSCVVDEPFYACYLQETGLEHPYRQEILASQSIQRDVVIYELAEQVVGPQVFYQKHMTHHMPTGMPMQWCTQLRHCFLIRDPAEVIASYLQKMPAVSEDAIGIIRQWELFKEITEITGERPLVIDSHDVLKDPAGILAALCDHWQIERQSQAMLNWPQGRRDSDGVWAGHWYQSVETSTGFSPYQKREPRLDGQHLLLAERMAEPYQQMARYRVQV